jgi:hypothetical protein
MMLDSDTLAVQNCNAAVDSETDTAEAVERPTEVQIKPRQPRLYICNRLAENSVMLTLDRFAAHLDRMKHVIPRRNEEPAAAKSGRSILVCRTNATERRAVTWLMSTSLRFMVELSCDANLSNEVIAEMKQVVSVLACPHIPFVIVIFRNGRCNDALTEVPHTQLNSCRGSS